MNTKLKLATSYGVKIPGIYRITNKETHRFYVGKSVNVLGRWIGHYSQEHNPILRNDIEKYGFAGFTFEILEVCEDVKLLSERERFYIETLSNENPDLIYNICIPNSNSKKHNHYDHPLSPEERYRIWSEAGKKGNKEKKAAAGKKGNKNKQVEYEGVKYDSCNALAAAQNVSIQTVSKWIRKGKAKEILTAEQIARRDKRRKQLNSISLEKRQEGSKKGGETSRLKYGKKVMDESGNIYDSKRQLSKAKGISKQTCRDRIKKGLYKELKTK